MLVSEIINENGYDFFVNRLIFPIKDKNGNVVGFSGRKINENDEVKYLNSKESVLFKKHEILFNANNLTSENDETNKLYVVEGFMDAIAFNKIGVNNCVALMGLSLSDAQVELIQNSGKTKDICLCLDNDDAGKKATIKFVRKLLSGNDVQQIKVIEFDSEFKDIDEVVQNNKKWSEKDYFSWYWEQVEKTNDLLRATNSFIWEVIDLAPEFAKWKIVSDCLKDVGYDKNELKNYFNQQLTKYKTWKNKQIVPQNNFHQKVKLDEQLQGFVYKKQTITNKLKQKPFTVLTLCVPNMIDNYETKKIQPGYIRVNAFKDELNQCLTNEIDVGDLIAIKGNLYFGTNEHGQVFFNFNANYVDVMSRGKQQSEQIRREKIKAKDVVMEME